jgi:dUTP pyrophosphatase
MRISLIHQNAKVPTQGTPGSVGYDLHATEDTLLRRGAVTAVPTGVVIELPADIIGSVRPRSSLSKRGLIVVLGTIDPDYRGEVAALIYNVGPEDVLVKVGDRIAQLTLEATFNQLPDFHVVPIGELSKTERGTGGFGHTGR